MALRNIAAIPGESSKTSVNIEEMPGRVVRVNRWVLFMPQCH